MPRLFSPAPLCASLVLALVAYAAWGQVQVIPGDFTLRPTVGPDAKTGARAQAGQAASSDQSFGSPPGSGAGETGFVSTNAPKAKTQATKAAKQPAEPAISPPAAAKLAARVPRTTVEPAVTGTVTRRPRPAEEADPYAPVGLRLGTFDVTSSAEFSLGYDDNAFRTATDALGSSFAKAEGRIEAKSNWSRHELIGELRGGYIDYLQVDGNDRPEAEAKLRGRIDVKSDSRIELEGRAALSTIAAGSPDAITSAKRPPQVYTLEGTAGYVHRFNRLELALRGIIERTTYQDAELISGGFEDLSDRNYTTYGPTLRGTHEITPDFKPFVEVAADRRVYDRKVDAGGVERSSRGLRALAGVEFGREGVLTGEAGIGFAKRRYDDPLLKDASGLIFDATLAWKASALTTVTLKANSEIGETSLAGASGVFTREASLTIDHAFRRWLIGSAGVTYGTNDYDGIDRRDDVLLLSASLTYYLNRYAALKAEVRREQLRSTVPGQDYTANIVMVGLRVQR